MIEQTKIEEKYSSTPIDYYVSKLKRRLMSSILGYPEFIFLYKIVGALLIATLAFTLFTRFLEGIDVEPIFNLI